MKKRMILITGLCMVLGLALTAQLGAQDKKKAAKMANLQGTVASVDKTKMTISIRSGTATRDAIYSADTKFLYGHSKDNKPGSADAVKDGYFISCGGTTEAGKPQVMAKECVYRETK